MTLNYNSHSYDNVEEEDVKKVHDHAYYHAVEVHDVPADGQVVRGEMMIYHGYGKNAYDDDDDDEVEKIPYQKRVSNKNYGVAVEIPGHEYDDGEEVVKTSYGSNHDENDHDGVGVVVGIGNPYRVYEDSEETERISDHSLHDKNEEAVVVSHYVNDDDDVVARDVEDDSNTQYPKHGMVVVA